MKKSVNVGGITIGGGAPISVQSMTNTDTRDVDLTVGQILSLEEQGVDIVRVSVYDEACARAIPAIKAKTHVPLVADIHFDYKLALLSVEHGIDKLRINPGNIGAFENVRRVADCAKANGVPIRVGVNSGSVERDILDKYSGPTPQALVESAMRHVNLLEQAGFYDIVISIKASGVMDTVEAYRIVNDLCDYPLHVGVTEAGFGDRALVKSSIGIGTLLLDGIGDTIRVSLTGDPIDEVSAAKLILGALDKLPDGIDFVSCPTCGRTSGDVLGVVKRLEAQLPKRVNRPLRIAVMGCVVNGPGEAREADIGIAFAPGGAAVFFEGNVAYSGERETTIERFIADCKGLCE